MPNTQQEKEIEKQVEIAIKTGQAPPPTIRNASTRGYTKPNPAYVRYQNYLATQSKAEQAQQNIAESGIKIESPGVLTRTVASFLSGQSNPSSFNPEEERQIKISQLNKQVRSGDISTAQYTREIESIKSQYRERTAQRTQDFGRTAAIQGKSEITKQREQRAVAENQGIALGTIQSDKSAASSQNSVVSQSDNVSDFVQAQKQPQQQTVSLKEQLDNLGLSTIYNVDQNAPLNETLREGGINNPIKSKQPDQSLVSPLLKQNGSYIGFSPSGEPIQGPARPYYQVTTLEQGTLIGSQGKYEGLIPKTRFFLSEESANRFIERVTKNDTKLFADNKELSPFGKLIQPAIDRIEELQKRKPQNIVESLLRESVYGHPLGFTKEILTTLGSLDNLGHQLEGLIKGKEPTAKEINVPKTFLSTTTDGIIEGKNKNEIVSQLAGYVKERGASASIGELSTLYPGTGVIKVIAKPVPIFLNTEKVGKEFVVFGKSVASKTAKGIRIGSIKPSQVITESSKIGSFELIQGGKQQTNFNIKVIDYGVKTGKLDNVYAEVAKTAIQAVKKSRNAPVKIISKGGTPQAVEGLTEKQSPALAKAIKQLQKPPVTAVIKDKVEPIGQVGGSMAENRQLLTSLTNDKPLIPGDFDIVVKNTPIAQRSAKKVIEELTKVRLSNQSFVQSGKRLTKVSSVEGDTFKTFVVQGSKGVFYHGTDLESAKSILKKNFSLKESGKQTKNYIERVTKNLSYATKRSEEISPPETIFLTPNPRLAERFALSASKSVGKAQALIKTTLKDNTKILRLKTPDPKKLTLDDDIRKAKELGYQGVLKPIGSDPKGNLELILFSKKAIKSREIIEQVDQPVKGSKVKKIGEFLDDKDLVEGNKEAVMSAEYLGKRVSNKGIKDEGIKFERLSDQSVKRTTSFLTLQDLTARTKQIKKLSGEIPQVKDFGKDWTISPILKRADKDTIKTYYDYKTLASNYRTNKSINPIKAITYPKKGRELEELAEKFKEQVKQIRPDLDFNKLVPDDPTTLNPIKQTDSLGSVATKAFDIERIVKPEKIKLDNEKPTIPENSISKTIKQLPRTSTIDRLSSRIDSLTLRRQPRPATMPLQSRSVYSISRPITKPTIKPLNSSAAIDSSRNSKSKGLDSYSISKIVNSSKVLDSPTSKASNSVFGPESKGSIDIFSPSSKSPNIPKSPSSPKSPGSPNIPKSPSLPKYPKSSRILSLSYHSPSPRILERPKKPLAIAWKSTISQPKERPRKNRFDFLGSSSEFSVEGLYNRKETTYGKKKIDKLFRQDKKRFKI